MFKYLVTRLVKGAHWVVKDLTENKGGLFLHLAKYGDNKCNEWYVLTTEEKLEGRLHENLKGLEKVDFNNQRTNHDGRCFDNSLFRQKVSDYVKTFPVKMLESDAVDKKAAYEKALSKEMLEAESLNEVGRTE